MIRRSIAALCLLGLMVAAGRVLAQSETCSSTSAACVFLPLLERSSVQGTSTPAPSNTPTETPNPTLAVSPTRDTRPTATPPAAPTATPAPLPPSYNACQADPNANAAPNYPVRIVAIDKGAETVTLQNRSGTPVDLSTWQMCSITGNQHHPIGGTLAPGQSRTFAGPGAPIWNNTQQDDGALYNQDGSLVSYYKD